MFSLLKYVFFHEVFWEKNCGPNVNIKITYVYIYVNMLKSNKKGNRKLDKRKHKKRPRIKLMDILKKWKNSLVPESLNLHLASKGTREK
jgi:hypothetical protein